MTDIEIIAEVGVNHNGDLNVAKRLVDVAASSGVDTIKFQTFVTDRFVSRHTPKAQYQKIDGEADDGQFFMLKTLELEPASWAELKDYTDKKDLRFLSTAFDNDSVDFLVELGQRRFKIPSGEIDNLPYLRKIGNFGYPILLSTGMATMQEIEAALRILDSAGTKLKDITILHCTTEYPAAIEDINLHAMETIRKTFRTDVGYSDHTLGYEVSIAAAALGATVIEKHITLDSKLPGPDHKASIEPEELTKMVKAIRSVERALGDGVKKPSTKELTNRYTARKSIVSSVPIKKGQIFSESNLCVKRPGTGLSPTQWDRVIGSHAVRDFGADELIEL